MNRYPSKRPKVGQVEKWETVYIGEIENDWRGAYGGTAILERGYPFPDFYRVKTAMGRMPTLKTSKLFYGESAHNQVSMYLYDLGFRDILSEVF